MSQVTKVLAMNENVMRIFKRLAAIPTQHRFVMKTGGTREVSRELSRACI
jgi:hypothetical protein